MASVTLTKEGQRKIVTGLWSLKRNLIVDPRMADFPLTCLFTGEHVNELTLMTLAQVKASNNGLFARAYKEEAQLAIPVSVKYRRQRATWSRTMRRILIIAGMVIIVLGVATPLLLGMKGEALGSTISVALAPGIIAVIVGFCFPYLDDMNGSKYISGMRFMSDGRILIPNVHEDVLAGLPELEQGFLDGFLGFDSLKLKKM